MSVSICDLRTKRDRRTRRYCPFHKRLCFGVLITCFDTVSVDFDCGTTVDYGYGYWRKPSKADLKRRQEVRAFYAEKAREAAATAAGEGT